MYREVRLRRMSGSVGATLPKSMAEHFHLSPGDSVLAVETDRGILLTPFDPTVEEALRMATETAKKYRNALRELSR